MKRFLISLYIVGLVSSHLDAEVLGIDSISKVLEISIKKNDTYTFIKFFPKTKLSFHALFGFYDDCFDYSNDKLSNRKYKDAALAPLYNNSYNIISYLFDSIYLDTNNFEKYKDYLLPMIVNLAIDIKSWEADAINYFQMGIIKCLKHDDNILLYLSQLSNQQQSDFFYFVFDGYYEKDDTLYKIIYKKQKKQIFKEQ